MPCWRFHTTMHATFCSCVQGNGIGNGPSVCLTQVFTEGARADFGATAWPSALDVENGFRTASHGQAVPVNKRKPPVSDRSSGTTWPGLAIKTECALHRGGHPFDGGACSVPVASGAIEATDACPHSEHWGRAAACSQFTIPEFRAGHQSSFSHRPSQSPKKEFSRHRPPVDGKAAGLGRRNREYIDPIASHPTSGRR